MNHPVGHMVRISTKEKPRPSSWVSRALRTIFFVLAAAPALCTDPRATYPTPSNCARRSATRMG
jgi:hypothetical protein